MAFTITVAEAGGSAFNGIYALAAVLTGATAAGGAGTAAQTTTAAASASVTPAGSNSLILFSLFNPNAGGTPPVFTAAANNSVSSPWDTAADAVNGVAYAHGRYTGTVTAGTAVTAGASAPTANASQPLLYAIYEILASGGTTPALDSSTPALATNSAGSSVTTASFTPPGGAVIALLVNSDGASLTGYTVSDTSGLGLTWTQRQFLGPGGTGGGVAVYTTTMPGNTAVSGADSASGVSGVPVIGVASSRRWITV